MKSNTCMIWTIHTSIRLSKKNVILMNCINFVNFLAVYTSDLFCFHQFLFKFNKLTFFSRQINKYWNINICILLSSYLALWKVRREVLIKINWNYLWLNSWCYSIQQSDLYRFGNEDCACLYWAKTNYDECPFVFYIGSQFLTLLCKFCNKA